MKARHIASRDNPLYKEIRQLASSAQARKKSGRTLLDGVHLCAAFLESAGVPLICVVSVDSLSHPEVAPLVAKCEADAAAECIVLPEALYNGISQVENGVGLTFVIATPESKAPVALTTSAVLLDRLQDPGNLGSILRSAAAAGIRQVFCAPETAQAWSPKVLRAGMGAHFLLEIVEQADLVSLIEQAKIPVLATSSHADRTIYDTDLGGEVAWIFGHEGQGVDPALLAAASAKVSIPHDGEMESLNVAASAAVCLFEQLRQRRLRNAAART